MTIPRKPYLIRAMHEWICDNHYTPHIVVDATQDGVSVPPEHVSDGKIILNIGARATEGLQLSNDAISFATRFGGTVSPVQLPCSAVLGIYARETGEGMIFTDETSPGPDGDDGSQPPPERPSLKVVK